MRSQFSPGADTLPFHADQWSGWVVWSWAAVYLALGVIPRVPSMPLPAWERADLLIHGLATALLSALAAVWLRRTANWPARAATVAFGLGAAIELIQIRVPDRGFEIGDLGADLIGALIGAGLHVLAMRAGTHRLAAALTVTGGAVATVTVGAYLVVQTLVG